jgi:hypothetical protein
MSSQFRSAGLTIKGTVGDESDPYEAVRLAGLKDDRPSSKSPFPANGLARVTI